MRKILACVDLSESSHAVIACARSLAAPDGKLVLLHVAAPDPQFVGYAVGPESVRENVAAELHQEHAAVRRLAEGVREPGLEVTPLTVQGVVSERILEHADRLPADFIVVAAGEHGALHHLFAGSIARQVLHGAKVPVVVVPRRAP